LLDTGEAGDYDYHAVGGAVAGSGTLRVTGGNSGFWPTRIWRFGCVLTC